MNESFSFEGCDRIVASLLRDVESGGFYVDVGAHHPITNSNTYYFYRKGWTGIAIDGSEKYKADWQRERPGDVVLNAWVGGGWRQQS